MNTPHIFLGSILLEPNRWKPGRPPSVRISEWSARAAEAGFDGWELWENHYLRADADEQSALREGASPVRVFNSYADFGSDDRSVITALAAKVRELPSVTAVKFNVGDDPQHIDRYRTAIASARAALPRGVSLWCECHPGTVLEDPARLPAFIGALDPCPFGVIIHPFLLSPEEIVGWGKIAGRHIVHAHLQMRDPKNPHRFVALSENSSRVDECLAALAEIRFNGSFTLEFARSVRSDHDDPATLFEDSVRDLVFLRSKLRKSTLR